MWGGGGEGGLGFGLRGLEGLGGGGDDRFSLGKVRCISMLVTAAHRLHSSSFLWFILRILSGSPKKELLRSLWVVIALTNPSVWILGTKG